MCQELFQPLLLLSLGHTKKWDIGSDGICMFNFGSNCHTVFHSNYTVLYSHHQRTKVSVCPYQNLLFSVLFVCFVDLVGVFLRGQGGVAIEWTEGVSRCGFDLRFPDDS